jgi:ankyrin repeat protein
MTRLTTLVLAAALCASCAAVSPSADDLRNDPHGHLVWAARTGDVAAIRALAASGVDLDASSVTPLVFVFPDFDHRRWTALQHAVQKHQVEAVRVLLASGANPDARSDGYTPLLIAAADPDPTMARLILDAGADVAASRTLLAQQAPGGPLWHLFEHAMASGTQSPQEGLDRLADTTPARR